MATEAQKFIKVLLVLLLSTFEYRHDQILAGKSALDTAQDVSSAGTIARCFPLCVIEAEFAKIGAEIKILWDDTGTFQKEIRAKVKRFPYMDINRNEKVDVSTIPSGLKK